MRRVCKTRNYKTEKNQRKEHIRFLWNLFTAGIEQKLLSE